MTCSDLEQSLLICSSYRGVKFPFSSYFSVSKKKPNRANSSHLNSCGSADCAGLSNESSIVQAHGKLYMYGKWGPAPCNNKVE